MTDVGLYEESYPPGVFTPGPPPTITTLAPPSIVVNTPTPVTVTGTNFTSGSRLLVDGVPQHATIVSPTTITYTAQADSVGTQDVRVVDRFGQVTAAHVLTVTATVGATSQQMLPANPGGYTIAAVQAWVEANPDQAQAVLDAENARGADARVTLVAWLDAFISPSQADDLPPESEPTTG